MMHLDLSAVPACGVFPGGEEGQKVCGKWFVWWEWYIAHPVLVPTFRLEPDYTGFTGSEKLLLVLTLTV